MTQDADFKAKVRERMARTGQSYTAARADLLASPPPEAPTQPQAPATGAPAVADRIPDPDPQVERVLRVFFEGERLRSIPTKRRARVVVLLELLKRFEVGRTYTELEVNVILRTAHDDVASLRRYLVEYGYLLRPGGVYSVVDEAPERDATTAQEVPADEAERLAALPHVGP